MVKNKLQQLVIAGLMVTIGLILPYFTAHAFGVPGTILLPMHIPVLLCGLISGPMYGAIAGLITPMLSSVLTGMPALYPMLPIMAVQLLTMGAVSGILYRKAKLNLYLSLLAAMLSGWAAYGLVFATLLLAGDGQLRALSVSSALLRGIPGIAAQLILIPPLVKAVQKRQVKTPAQTKDLLGQAQALINGGDISCVVIQDDRIIHTADGRGVSPLLKLYRDDPGKLRDAFVVDKIIGKAAAMILVLGGATRVYGLVMSVAGRRYLEQHGITAEYGRCVDVISNREQNGICPIEKSVMDIDDPVMGLTHIEATICDLMKKAV